MEGVILESFQHQAVPMLERGYLVRARAGVVYAQKLVAEISVIPVFSGSLILHDQVLVQNAHDGHAGQEGRIFLCQVEGHRVLVDHLRRPRLDHFELGAHRSSRSDQPFHGEGNVLGGDLRTVMEFQPFVQPESIRFAIGRNRPGLSDPGPQFLFGVRVREEQGIIDIQRHNPFPVVCGLAGVHGSNLHFHGPAHFSRLAGSLRSPDGERKNYQSGRHQPEYSPDHLTNLLRIFVERSNVKIAL